MLTYGSEEDTCELHDELASVIRKQLHHSDPKLVTSKIDIYLTFIVLPVTLLVCNIACTYMYMYIVHVSCRSHIIYGIKRETQIQKTRYIEKKVSL